MIKMVKIIALMTICLLSISTQAEEFPKLLWTFWEGDLSDPYTNIFLKLCLHSKKEHAKKSGWEFFLVTYETLPQFLTPEDHA